MPAPFMGQSPGQASAYQELQSGLKMPEFNSPQFNSPNGPQLGGTSAIGFRDPFGGQAAPAGGGMGGGQGVATALQGAANAIVASNRQLAAAIEKLAAAFQRGGGGGGGGPGRGPGGPPMPGRPRRPGGEAPGNPSGYGGSRRTLGSAIQNTIFNSAASLGGRFGGTIGGLAGSTLASMAIGGLRGALNMRNELQGVELSEQYADFFEGMREQSRLNMTTMTGNIQGQTMAVGQANTMMSMGMGAMGGPTGLAQFRGQQALAGFMGGNRFGAAVRRSNYDATMMFLADPKNRSFAQQLEAIKPGAGRLMAGAALEGMDIFNLSAMSSALGVERSVLKQTFDSNRSYRENYITSAASSILERRKTEVASDAERKSLTGEVSRIINTNVYSDLGAATSVAQRFGVRARYGSSRFVQDPERQARFRAANRAKASAITALQSLGGVHRGFEAGISNYMGNILGLRGGLPALLDASGVTNPDIDQINSLIGGQVGSMTSTMGMGGDSLGMSSQQMLSTFNNIAMGQGFAGFRFLRQTGKMSGTRRLNDDGTRVLRAIDDTSQFGAGMITSHHVMAGSTVRAAMQTGIAQSTIGAAGGVGAGGQGNMIFSGKTILEQINAEKLRGTGAQSYIAAVRSIQNQQSARGALISDQGAGAAAFINAGRGSAFGDLFTGGGGMRQAANAAAKGDVSGRFRALMGDFGESILMMDALRQANGSPVAAHAISAGFSLEQKAEIIKRNVKDESGQRAAFMSIGFTPAQVEAAMKMDGASRTLASEELKENERMMSRTLLASDAENQIQDARTAAESKYQLESLNVADQILRANVASKATLDDILGQLRILNNRSRSSQQGVNQAKRALGKR